MNDPIQILVVDDSTHFLEAASDFLQAHEALRVVATATGAEEAIQKSRQLKVDVILLDFNLAGSSGLELIPLFRKFLPDVKIIVLTLMEGEGYRIAAVRAGADTFLQKKALTTALVPHILRLTQRSSLPENVVLDGRESRFFRLVENSPDLIYRYDFAPKRGFTYVNPAAAVITGYTPEEHYADPDLGFKIVHPEDRHILEELSQGNDPAQGPLVLRWIRKDGAIVWMEQHNISIHDANGKLTAVEGIARDVTAQHMAEKALRESEDRFRDLVENSQELMCTHDLAGQILSANPAATGMLGYPLNEILKMNIRDILVPEAQSLFQRYIDEIVRDGKGSGFMHVRTVTGESRIWEYSNTLRRDGVNKPLVRGMARDVTEQKRAEVALRESRNQLTAVINSAMDAIIVISEDQQIRIFNPAAEEMFGYKVDEIVGLPVDCLLPERFRVAHHQQIKQFSQTGLTRRSMGNLGAIYGIRANGTEFPIEASISQIELHGEKFFTIILRDVTERMRAEEILRQRERALQKAQAVASVGNWVWHVPENRLEWSDEMYHIFGIEKETFTGNLPDVISRAIHPADRAAVEQANLAVMQDKNPMPLEYRVIWQDGTVRTVWAEAGELVLDASGAALKLTGIVQDITRRKQIEAALRESERFATATVNALSVHIAILDEHGTILAVNRAWRDFAIANHAAPERVCEGANYLQVCEASRGAHSEEAASMAQALRAMLNGTQQDFVLEYPCHAPDEKRWFISHVTKFEGEGPVRVVVAHENITERKLIEDALRRSEEQYRNLFEDSPVPLWVEDFSEVKRFVDELLRRGVEDFSTYLKEHPALAMECAQRVRILDVNSAAMKVYHAREKAELLGNPALVVHGLRLEQFEIELTQIAKGLLNFERDAIDQTLTGVKIHVHVRSSVVPGFEDSLAKVIVSTMDITERKQAEEALREKERLLSESQRMGNIGSWSFDIIADTVQFSEEMYRLLDVKPDEVPPNVNGLQGIAYASDRQAALEWIESIRAGIQPKELDARILRKNGELRFIRTHGAFVYGADGKPTRFIGTAQDVTERKLADLQIHQQMEQLNALRRIDQAIISGNRLHPTLDAVLAEVVKQLRVDAADILLLNSEDQILVYAAGRGFRTQAAESALVRVGESHAGRAAQERRLIHIESLTSQPSNALLTKLLAGEDFVSYHGVPLIVKGRVRGVLEVFHRLPFQSYPEWIDFLATVAGQAAIAVESMVLSENLQAANRALAESYDATIEGWSRALDLRDKELEGHTLRVTEMTMKLAARMGIREPELVHIKRGALLHDIGKMGVPDSILFKPDRLTTEEWEQMHRHAQFAYDLLRPIAFLRPALDIPYCHHEKWDGSGYPRGLKGEEIPMSARLFAVVDVWDALTSDRPYRPAWSREEALAYISEQSGKHFDRQVVQVFLEAMQQGGETLR